MPVQNVWILLLAATGSLTIAPQTFATKADCEAVAAHIPIGNGSTLCIPARVTGGPAHAAAGK